MSRFLRDKENAARFRDAKTTREILVFSEFMELEVQDQLLVADGLTPLEYRVYPETPYREVVGLMVRQGSRAVPVVGEKLEFLGLITSGDAIRYLVPERLSRGQEGEATESPPRPGRSWPGRSCASPKTRAWWRRRTSWSTKG